MKEKHCVTLAQSDLLAWSDSLAQSEILVRYDTLSIWQFGFYVTVFYYKLKQKKISGLNFG